MNAGEAKRTNIDITHNINLFIKNNKWWGNGRQRGTRRSAKYRLDTQPTQHCLILKIDWSKYEIYCPLLWLSSSYHKSEFLRNLRKAVCYKVHYRLNVERISFFLPHCILPFHSVQFCCIYNHYVFCFGRMHFVIKAFYTTRGMISFTINISAQPASPTPPRIFKIGCKTQMYSNWKRKLKPIWLS